MCELRNLAAAARWFPVGATTAGDGIRAETFAAIQGHDGKGQRQLLSAGEFIVLGHGFGGVDQKHHAHLVFFAVELHVWAAQAGKCVPVDEARIIPGDVIAIV